VTSVLARLRELEAKATPGPWCHENWDAVTWRWFSSEMGANDRALIAESRNHLAALLDVAEAAQAVRKRHPGNAESADLALDSALARLEAE
jgi:hypothetical protein